MTEKKIEISLLKSSFLLIFQAITMEQIQKKQVL